MSSYTTVSIEVRDSHGAYLYRVFEKDDGLIGVEYMEPGDMGMKVLDAWHVSLGDAAKVADAIREVAAFIGHRDAEEDSK